MNIIQARQQLVVLLGESDLYLVGTTRRELKGLGKGAGIARDVGLLVVVRILERKEILRGQRCHRRVDTLDIYSVCVQNRLIRAHEGH